MQFLTFYAENLFFVFYKNFAIQICGNAQSKHFHLLRGKCVSRRKACHVMDSSDLIGSFNNALVAYWSI